MDNSHENSLHTRFPLTPRDLYVLTCPIYNQSDDVDAKMQRLLGSAVQLAFIPVLSNVI
jgi:hypothetical protein